LGCESERESIALNAKPWEYTAHLADEVTWEIPSFRKYRSNPRPKESFFDIEDGENIKP
jgi:hypothetical protein